MLLRKGVLKIQSNFIEITLRYGCSPVNLLLIFRTPFPKDTSEQLLLIHATLLMQKLEKKLLPALLTKTSAEYRYIKLLLPYGELTFF